MPETQNVALPIDSGTFTIGHPYPNSKTHGEAEKSIDNEDPSGQVSGKLRSDMFCTSILGAYCHPETPPRPLAKDSPYVRKAVKIFAN